MALYLSKENFTCLIELSVLKQLLFSKQFESRYQHACKQYRSSLLASNADQSPHTVFNATCDIVIIIIYEVQN